MSMMVETYFQNYAQACNIRAINRQSSDHPNFTDTFDADSIEPILTGKKLCLVDESDELKLTYIRTCLLVDLLAWTEQVSQVKFRP